jgi:hypothetical protein
VLRDIVGLYGEDLLAPRPSTKLEDHSLSAFRDCLFIILAAAFHIGDRCTIRNLRMRHAVVTRTHSLSFDAASFVKWVRTFRSNVIPSKHRSMSSQKNGVLNTFSLPCHRLCLGGTASLKGPIVHPPLPCHRLCLGGTASLKGPIVHPPDDRSINMEHL